MLQTLQKQRVMRFLSVSETNPWAVLILDKKSECILAPLIKTSDLRECFITSHFLIENKRQKIRNTPAIYFVEANDSNVEAIKKDIEKEIYSTFHLNFIGFVSRIQLESLAIHSSKFNRGMHIKSVIDQFIDFVALQNNLFSLHRKNTYLNPISVEEIADSLLGIFFTLEESLVIVDETNLKNEISNRLNKMLKSTKIVKESRKKALLILLDRSFDIKTPLEHVWNYSGLVDDLLEMELNKVKLPTENLEISDEFWQKNYDEYFPVVADEIEHELTDYKKEMALRCLDEKSDKKKIEEALEKAPTLARKKQSMHVHVSVSMAIVEKVKKRSIDEFFRIENNSFKNSELIDVSEKGNENDILRLGITLLSKENKNIIEALFKQRKINTKFLTLFEDEKIIIPQGTSYKNMVAGLLGSVKKLLPISKDSILSRKVEEILNKIKNDQTDELNILYPFSSRLYEREISKIVVFINGGTTYSELKSLNELSKKINIEILLGSTEILNADRFIEQLKQKHNI